VKENLIEVLGERLKNKRAEIEDRQGDLRNASRRRDEALDAIEELRDEVQDIREAIEVLKREGAE